MQFVDQICKPVVDHVIWRGAKAYTCSPGEKDLKIAHIKGDSSLLKNTTFRIPWDEILRSIGSLHSISVLETDSFWLAGGAGCIPVTSSA